MVVLQGNYNYYSTTSGIIIIISLVCVCVMLPSEQNLATV